MHMLVYNQGEDVHLERAISACREAQSYVRPIVIDQTKYRSGVTCDQKLASLVSLVNDSPSCAALRPALECLDDLVFQMKCVSMEPILAIVEKIECNVNKLVQSHSTVEDATPPGEVIKEDNNKCLRRRRSAACDDFGHESSHDAPSTASSEGTDPFYFDDRSSANSHPFSQHRRTFGESGDGASLVGLQSRRDAEKQTEISDALNASQAIINGLLNSLDDSGETKFLEVVMATLEQRDQDAITEQKTFDSEADAADAELRKANSDNIDVDPRFRRRGLTLDPDDSDVDYDTDESSMALHMSRSDSDMDGDLLSQGHEIQSNNQEDFFDKLDHVLGVRKEVEKRMERVHRNEEFRGTNLTNQSSTRRNILKDSGETFLELIKATKKKDEGPILKQRVFECHIDVADDCDLPKSAMGVIEVDSVHSDLPIHDVVTMSEGSNLSDSGLEMDTDDDSSIFRDLPRVDGDIEVEVIPHHEIVRAGLQDEFIDRMHHFFEVRKKVRKRMERIDPSKRLQNIEMITHSGGIQKKDGSYKIEYQQPDEDGNAACNLSQIYAAARQSKSVFLGFLYKICDKVNGLDHFHARLAPLKPHDRASEKAKSEYSNRSPGPCETWLYDILRATITCKTIKQMESINKYLIKKAHIVQAKNRFLTPAYNGYRDLLYHIKLPYQYKEGAFFIVEIQVQLCEVEAMQNQFGLNAHKLYFRSFFAGRLTEDVLKDLELLENHGRIDDEFIETLLESDNPDQLTMYAQLLQENLDCFHHSLELYARVLKVQKSTLGEYHAKTGATYQRIGLLQCQQGDFDASLMNLNKALEINQKAFGSRHPAVATTRSHIGNLICLTGDDMDRALREHKSSLAIRRETLGTQHVDVATSYQNIGLSLGHLGDFDGSVAAYREAIKILQNVLEPNHPDVAATHSMIGTALCQQGMFDEAMEEFLIGHEIRVNRLGKNHPGTADSHTEIGNMHCALGNFLKAEWRHREALRIRGAVYGREHPDFAVSLSNIGFVLNQKGDYDGALSKHQSALEIREVILGKRHPDSKASRKSIRAALNRVPEL